MKNELNRTIIIVATIIGIAILGFGYLNYKTKMDIIKAETIREEKNKVEKENQENARELKLSACKLEAERDYTDYWNAQCKVQGRDKKTDDCSLPSSTADDIEARRQKYLDNCIRLYGN